MSITDYTKIDKVIDILSSSSSHLLKDSFLFDFYINNKKNEIKVGYRFIFQSFSKTLTDHESRYCMAQAFIPEITDGDKRILIVDGEPMPYALARIPAKGETRGNLAAGGRGVARPLSESDWHIANTIGPKLKEKGLIFVGLDVIGDKVTEINVTSPTCIQEIDNAYGTNISGKLMDAIEKRIQHK